MNYDLSNKGDVSDFNDKAKYYIEKGVKVSLKRITEPKTISQNKYLHALFGIIGLHFGYTIEEVKQVVKMLREDVFTYERNGYKFIKSFSVLTKEEVSDVINWLRDYMSTKHSLYLMTSEEYLQHKYNVDNEIEKNKNYLI